MGKITTSAIRKMKADGVKITMLTAYDYSMAVLVDAAGIDIILVGDSLGMVMLGYPNTLPVTLDEMIHHTKAVVRGALRSLVVLDLPFMTFQVSVEDTLKNAGRAIKETGCESVKLEGGEEICDRVQALTAAGIPVVGHLGLTPQSVHQLGGYKIQGKDASGAEKLLNDSISLQQAGCFCVVYECIPWQLARTITAKLDIPTIGIGSGVFCDGQVLVIHDVLGMYDKLRPKFVKQYGAIGAETKKAVEDYVREVREGVFPDESHSFTMDEEELKKSMGNVSQ